MCRMMDYVMMDYIKDQAILPNPDWNSGGRVHNWKNHVPDYVRGAWPTFTVELRLMLARWADDIADREEWE